MVFRILCTLAVLAGSFGLWAGTALANGTGTIVVYRPSIMGLIYQPKVFVNGQETGQCTAGRKFVVKVPAGQHWLSAKTIEEKAVLVSVAAGQTIYVRCSIGMGLVAGVMQLEQIPARSAKAKAAKPKSAGSYTVKSRHAALPADYAVPKTSSASDPEPAPAVNEQLEPVTGCARKVWDPMQNKRVCEGDVVEGASKTKTTAKSKSKGQSCARVWDPMLNKRVCQ